MSHTAKISSSSIGLHTLHMEGNFVHPHWVAFLFSSLSQHNISVVSGRALQDATQAWDASFQLNFKQSQALPFSLDYIELAHRGSLTGDTEQPRLSSFNIVQRHYGLELHLVGPDQI